MATGFRFTRRNAAQQASENRRQQDEAHRRSRLTREQAHVDRFNRMFVQEMDGPEVHDEQRLEQEIRRTGSVRVLRVF